MNIGKDISTQSDIGISTDATRRHVYIIGKSGSGKTNFLEHIALTLAEEEWGMCIIDIHGEFAQKVADTLPDDRFWKDAIYWEPYSDRNIGFNPLKDISIRQRPLVTDNILSTFYHVFRGHTPRSKTFYDEMEEHILGNAIRILLDNNLSLIEIPRLLTDMAFRDRLLLSCTDDLVRDFWALEFDTWNAKQLVEYTASLMTKLDAFIANPAMRAALSNDGIDPLRIMTEGKILIINLSKGKMGQKGASFLGALLATTFGQKAYEREGELKDFALIIDEFQNFTTTSFITTVSEARKYHLTLIAANQFLDQLPEQLKDAIIGTVGNLIVFRCGAQDAPLLAAELDLDQPRRLKNLPKFQALIRTADDPNVHQIATHPPRASKGRLQAVRKLTEARYGLTRNE